MAVESISLVAKHAAFDDPWAPRRIARVDDYEVKLAKAFGAFAWHSHLDADELFLVTRGNLEIQIEGQDSILLGPGELCVIPKGVRHRPIARSEDVHLMLFERSGIINTGDSPASELTQVVVDL